MRLWYVRHGVSWAPLLACCITAAAAFVLLPHWPRAEAALPLLALTACSAAAGFVFDEFSGDVVAVTPRGAGWRRSTRLALALLPAAVWCAGVRAIPQEHAAGTGPWTLVGLVCITVAVGIAGLLSRYGVASPGSPVAAGVAVLVLAPPVVGPMAGWDSVVPPTPGSHEVMIVWWGLGIVALLLVAAAVRPGLR